MCPPERRYFTGTLSLRVPTPKCTRRRASGLLGRGSGGTLAKIITLTENFALGFAAESLPTPAWPTYRVSRPYAEAPPGGAVCYCTSLVFGAAKLQPLQQILVCKL